ncbi:MAG TPA: DUF4382 domain-containing protein [Gammaproteobacteria bacterium]|nr:DUF4382 domain-containing protein [Gammaproteobacteria bacterium]
MASRRLYNWLIPILAAGTVVTACDGGGDGAATGDLSMGVTDAPVDNATKVVVEFTGVEIHGPNDQTQTISFDSTKTIDLLNFTGNAAEPLFEDETVLAGDYQWARLQVNAERNTIDSYIEVTGGGQHSLYIPSGSETGLKMNTGFSVPEDGNAAFTIDFDLRKSVHEDPSSNEYILRPTLRLLDNDEVGTIAGTVNNSEVPADCDPAVYVFEGGGVTPDDQDGKSPDPVNSAIPELNGDTGHYDYEIGWLAEGDYTVSYTCDAAADDPATDDGTVTFDYSENATVTATETTDVDFP